MTMFAFPLAVLASVSCLASGASRASEPTDLDAFVAKPSVGIEFSQAIGTIESSDAKVEVTALVANDTADASQRMRGVRLSMKNSSGIDHVYVDESQLASVQADLADIKGGIAELTAGQGAPYRVQVTASCWMPAHPQRILCPSYRVGPDWSGITLGALGSSDFAFPSHRPAELAALIKRAIEAFSAH